MSKKPSTQLRKPRPSRKLRDPAAPTKLLLMWSVSSCSYAPEMSTLSFIRKYSLVFSDKYCLVDATSVVWYFSSLKSSSDSPAASPALSMVGRPVDAVPTMSAARLLATRVTPMAVAAIESIELRRDFLRLSLTTLTAASCPLIE